MASTESNSVSMSLIAGEADPDVTPSKTGIEVKKKQEVTLVDDLIVNGKKFLETKNVQTSRNSRWLLYSLTKCLSNDDQLTAKN